MKTKYILITAFLATSIGLSAHSQAQTTRSWEYGGLRSGISHEEAEQIREMPRNLKADIQHVLKEVAYTPDPSKARDYLLNQAKSLVQGSGKQSNRLQLVQSLSAGITLVQYIQETTVATHQAPQGTVRQEVRILKHAFKMADQYFESDKAYVESIQDVHSQNLRQSDWAKFGVELANFIGEMSEGVLHARTQYAINRWALGVLERKLLDDRNRPVFKSSLNHLSDALSSLPNLIAGDETPYWTDPVYVEKTRFLKRTASMAAADIQNEMQDVAANEAMLEKADAQARADEQAAIQAAQEKEQAKIQYEKDKAEGTRRYQAWLGRKKLQDAEDAAQERQAKKEKSQQLNMNACVAVAGQYLDGDDSKANWICGADENDEKNPVMGHGKSKQYSACVTHELQAGNRKLLQIAAKCESSYQD